jgi:predicted Zn finger-like uncharacterized protein
MSIRITCPACGESFRIDDARRGKKVRCRACDEAIVVDSEDDDDDERPEPRRSRRRRERDEAPAGKGLLIGLIVGGIGVFAIGSGVVVWALLQGPRTLQAPVAVRDLGHVAPAPPGPAPVGPIEIQTGPVAPAELGPARKIQAGVSFREARLVRGGVPMRVWYYEPAKSTAKLPLVVVPPAGSTLFTGMDLGDGDRAEHYPYVRAGFAVMSFEIDGHVPNVQTAGDAALMKGAREFRAAQGGLANAKAALDFVLAKAPNVDPQRIYVAGHSSAATLALLYAAHEPRLKGCASYCGVANLETRLAQAIPELNRAMPGYADFLRQIAPNKHAERLSCPVLLFHAQDDDNVPVQQTTEFAELLKKTNPRVTLLATARGGHYDSMIREGIPRGIQFFKELQKGS